MPAVIARRDPSLSAVVVSRVPLFYSDGADPERDRPANVRAGSSLAWFGGRIAVIQDDVRFVALVHPDTLHVDAVPLPRGPGGHRQYDDELHGRKHLKMDFEASTVVPAPDGEQLLAFGSGSTPYRERIAVLTGTESAAEIVQADTLYAALHDATKFSGSELNVEGAVFRGDTVQLFNRGNGAPRDGLLPVDATCHLDWRALDAYLRAGGEAAPPAVRDVVQYDLGMLSGTALGFTDASVTPLGLLYTASAEDSPDAVRDGEVTGSAIGALEEGGTPRWAELVHPDGSLFREKVEGLCASRHNANQIYVITDPDDARAPAELCKVVLEGPWAS